MSFAAATSRLATATLTRLDDYPSAVVVWTPAGGSPVTLTKRVIEYGSQDQITDEGLVVKTDGTLHALVSEVGSTFDGKATITINAVPYKVTRQIRRDSALASFEFTIKDVKARTAGRVFRDENS